MQIKPENAKEKLKSHALVTPERGEGGKLCCLLFAARARQRSANTKHQRENWQANANKPSHNPNCQHFAPIRCFKGVVDE
jgi:type IV secretory pathway VirD2 relaxase